MIHNDILRSLRFILNISDARMLTLVRYITPDTQVDFTPYLKKEDEEGFLPCPDALLCAFLDGVIIERRGRREGVEPPQPLERLNNNEILKKIRIAFDLKQDDIEALIARTDFKVSSAEINALFRKPSHKNYRTCGDQFLRYLLKGLAMQERPNSTAADSNAG